MTTSAAAIRDLCLAAIEALTPRTLAHDRFERHRADLQGGQTFEDWLTKNPQQLRRFIVRDDGNRSAPPVMGGDYQRERVTFDVVVAYPLTNRYGAGGSRDLDKVIEEDERQIDYAIGAFGSATFGTDTSPLVNDQVPAWRTQETDSGVMLLLGRVGFEFWRTAP